MKYLFFRPDFDIAGTHQYNDGSKQISDVLDSSKWRDASAPLEVEEEGAPGSHGQHPRERKCSAHAPGQRI